MKVEKCFTSVPYELPRWLLNATWPPTIQPHLSTKNFRSAILQIKIVNSFINFHLTITLFRGENERKLWAYKPGQILAHLKIKEKLHGATPRSNILHFPLAIIFSLFKDRRTKMLIRQMWSNRGQTTAASPSVQLSNFVQLTEWTFPVLTSNTPFCL